MLFIISLITWFACLVFFDLYYFVRSVLVVPLHYLFFRPVNSIFLEDTVIKSICLTTDLDLSCHMNNARYIRECDFARFNLWLGAGLKTAFNLLFTGKVIVSASTVRYRKPISFGQKYNIVTKISYWDERAFYFEQKFITDYDNFVRSVAYVKQTMVGITPSETVRMILERDLTPPDPPSELMKWIEYNSLSSDALKKST